MTTFRTKFKGEIIAEFLPPTRPSSKAVIIAVGMPSTPCKPGLLEYWAKRGYWAFMPRYRGTWESGGQLLRQSPHLDILNVINSLNQPITELWHGQVFKPKITSVVLYGSSFGGPAVLLNSKHPLVTKVIAMSPVMDWRRMGKGESIDFMAKAVPRAFGQAFRSRPADWRKLKTGTFYNPATAIDQVDGRKVLIIYHRDDQIVPFGPVVPFAQQTGSNLQLTAKGGHLGVGKILIPKYEQRVRAFLRQR